MALPEKPAPRAGAKPNEITTLLDQLGASDSLLRERVATELFGRGCDFARQATKEWFSDADLMRCFAPLDTGLPQATVGIAVHPETFEILRAANGSPKLADVPADIDAREFELHFAHGVRLDVLTTRDPGGEGTMARFLSKRGEGIQQVELATRDADRAAQLLRERFGLQAVYPAARPGADGMYVNFLLLDFVAATGEKKKLLVELVEDRSAK